jgi:CheY-like chemotaxis protein
MTNGQVLVVASKREDRERFGRWLEAGGFEVLSCEGPAASDLMCAGTRTGTCPFAPDADLVILDSALPGNHRAAGAAAGELINIYAALGKPVVEISTLSRDVMPPAGHLRWPPSRDDLLEAVRSRFHPTGGGA